MKKLVTSALLIGLLLGTASPVFAVDGVQGTQATSSTPVQSEVKAKYTVSIPAQLSIDLMGEDPDGILSKSVVTLTKLTAAGSVLVTAAADELVLKNEAGTVTEDTIPTKLTNGTATTTLEPFALSNTSKTQPIRIETAEISENHLPGIYNGSIIFTFDYSTNK